MQITKKYYVETPGKDYTVTTYNTGMSVIASLPNRMNIPESARAIEKILNVQYNSPDVSSYELIDSDQDPFEVIRTLSANDLTQMTRSTEAFREYTKNYHLFSVRHMGRKLSGLLDLLGVLNDESIEYLVDLSYRTAIQRLTEIMSENVQSMKNAIVERQRIIDLVQPILDGERDSEFGLPILPSDVELTIREERV